jgi:hypothetical protein
MASSLPIYHDTHESHEKPQRTPAASSDLPLLLNLLFSVGVPSSSLKSEDPQATSVPTGEAKIQVVAAGTTGKNSEGDYHSSWHLK